MENKQIAKVLQLLTSLMELHEVNPFKIKSVASAAFKVDKLGVRLAEQNPADVEKIEGIGKSLAAKIREIISTGALKELDDLLLQTPSGIVEMLAIKGIGPKKISVIWKELGIETVGELYYACNENRLIEAKGFGAKTQEDIKNAIEFKMASSGKFLYARLENFVISFTQSLRQQFSNAEIVGEFRRKCEIIHQLDWLLQVETIPESITIAGLEFEKSKQYVIRTDEGILIQLHWSNAENFAKNYIQNTGNEAHLRLLGHIPDGSSEKEIYQKLGMDFIPSVLREGAQEVEWAKKHQLPKLITFEDLKGTLHNHSTWSDGVHTLEEMALYCRDELKLEYLGICDHSKSAFYANGLSEERVIAQHLEIDRLNQKLAPFRIFKGIESDILNDGSLDYADEILQKFDFVVASVHSNLKMDEEKATQRLIKAIENKYTTILGHPTGRLLLSRNGYPVDFKKIIDACAAHQVVIEINANPLRLDLDWRWHQYAIEKGVLLSINPDAHRTIGLLDIQYGIYVAQKGGLTAENCLNSLTLQEIDSFFHQKKLQ